MTENQQVNSNPARNAKPLSTRRLTLLASVASLGIAVFIAGAAGFPSSRATGTSTAYAATERAPSFADLVAKVKPAVISVRVKIDQASNSTGLPQSDTEDQTQGDNALPFGRNSPPNRFFGEIPQPQQHQVITGEGSGFFISADGYAVTNDHVVDHAKSVQVTADDGTIYTAKVIGTDPKSDLALIKVDAPKDFSFVTFADEMPRIGDWVVAVGNPFGLGGTVTAGIVSARGRDIGTSPYDDYMQIDAPINRGNSGGPTFDINGNVVGVNTAIYSPSGGSVGIGFDIPAHIVQPVIAQLKQTGYVTRAQIGVEVQAVTSDIADSLGMKTTHGALVDVAQPGSPAAKAGIEAGDVITAVDGTTVKDSGELARRVAMMTPGRTVTLAILRNGAQNNLTLTLGKLSDQQQARAEPSGNDGSGGDTPQLGLSIAPARDALSAGEGGVVVTALDPDGPASDHGIAVGDVILTVGGKSVSTEADVRGALRQASSENRHTVLLRVKTAKGLRFIALPIGQG